MLNWLWKAMGYHVCEEFTRWTPKDRITKRHPDHHESIRNVLYVEEVDHLLCRECTICGMVDEKRTGRSSRIVLVHEEQMRIARLNATKNEQD